MDGTPSADAHRRGGGRGGGLGRKGSGGRTAYRRVQTSVGDAEGDSNTKTSPGVRRSVQVVEDNGKQTETTPSVPFKSSLRSSLQDSNDPSPAKRNERSVRVEKDRAANTDRIRERPRNARSRSPAPQKRDLQVQTKEPRRVISLSSPSPQKEPGQTKRFVSSLTQSMDHGNDRGSRQDREDRGGKGLQGSSLRRSNSREPRQWSGEAHGSYRHAERGSGTRSVSRTRLTRKSSTDSVSSQRSDRSDVSHRSERYNEEYRSSLNDGPQPVRRLSSGSTGQAPFKSSLSGSFSATKSSQDVRIRKERPLSGSIGRSFGRPAQDTASRRSSLDGGASSLRRVNPNSPLGPSTDKATSHDARIGGPSDSQRSPSAPGGLRKNVPVGDSISPKPQKSTAAQDKEEGSVKAAPVVDEAERKRLAETLKERMESRKLERGSSLAQMMKAPLPRKGSMDDESRQSPFGARKDFESDKNSSGADAEKDARTREYYAKLDKENEEKEAARRAAPFKSSLTSSIETAPPRTVQSSLSASIDRAPARTLRSSLAASMEPRTLKSSLAASLAPSRSVVSRIKKIQYTLTELRRLVAAALPRPADLPDMKIVDVVQVRDPSSVSKRSSGRLGRGIGKSIGGSIRMGDRLGSGGRGSRGQGGSGGGRRDRPGRGGGRSGGRGGRGGGGGREYGRPPPPPLYDGPIEPLVVTENRWKPIKEKDATPLEKTLSHVNSLLNKLTREKFVKLTNELCAVEIDSFALLSSIVSVIMDKALEEPNFADVYADLCKEFHTRTLKKSWSFLHVLSDEKNSFFWSAIDKSTFTSFAGPFDSPHSCLEDTAALESAAISTCDSDSISTVQFRRHGDYLVAVGEQEAGAFYYSKRKISEIDGDEPFGGPFESAELAGNAAETQVTFTRLLVNRCQVEFEKTNKHTGPQEEKKEDEEVDPRRREILAMRAKAKMLGNIRFIGELYKVDLIKQSGVQGCIFYLLGLELIPGESGQEVQAQAVRFPDEQDLEALCKMLATAGKKFDQPKTKTIMKIIILRMVELSEDQKLPSRARFLVKDVLETRDHMWEPRRKEMQQKTLEEVRREAQKLQQQGKNAQHDDVQRRRHKTRISSAQLAKQSSNLIVAKKEEPDEPDEPEHDDKELSPAQMSSRIKNIIQEYISIVDLDEATTCVQELAVDPYHIEFAEQAINTALEGKTSEREHAVDLLVGLYERGGLDANSIQAALVNVMEFLEDMRIDLPLIHQYSALIFGRLVAAGCFGLSWIISEALAHCVECKLTSLVFPEVLSVLEVESDERTVIRMLTDEEITPESVLPAAVRANEADVEAYLRENGIEDFFGGGDSDEEDELDPEIAGNMRSTLEEYLSVKDFSEVVQCINEFETAPDRWRHFAHITLAFSLEAKQSVRTDVARLLVQLFTAEHLTSDDIEAAIESILDDYDDLRVDIPQLAVNLSELWTPLFMMEALSVQWLSEACSHLVESGRAVDVLDALLSSFGASDGQEALVTWWKKQSNVDAVWTQMSSPTKPQDERLAKWKLLLQ